ncbi:hypothetical protein Tco_0236193 [Tanacetum coccineum]
MKGSFINGFSALKSHLTFLSKKDVPGINESAFERAFSHIFAEDVHTFTRNSVITESSDIDSRKKNTCSKTGNDQSSENQGNTSGDESSRSCNDKSTSGDDTDIIPSCDIEPLVEVPNTAEYNMFSNERQHSEKHAAECADERATAC